MANRFIRGSFVRNAWDFYETGTAFAFASQTAGIGTEGLMLINNGVGNSYLDIYRGECSCSSQGDISWAIGPSSAATAPEDPDTYFNSPCQLDLGGPPGLMVFFTAYTPAGVVTVRQRLDNVGYDVIELASGGPFVSLPPMYGLAVIFSARGNNTMSVSIWYQSITDHAPPAS